MSEPFDASISAVEALRNLHADLVAAEGRTLPDPASPVARGLLLKSLSTALDDAATAARALVALEETRRTG